MDVNHDHRDDEREVKAIGVENNGLKERKMSWGKLRRVDSLSLEAGKTSFSHTHSSKVSWMTTASLAFQSIGVVYGDIGTSPLYVFSSTFTGGIRNTEDVYGALSLIIYTLILVPMIKYVFVVLLANDNGDGGTFALYSLMCRYAKVSLIPNQQAEDRELSNYTLDVPSNKLRRAQNLREKLEHSKTCQITLFLVTILGTSMVIGDGVLTPCISVLSAVSGIKSLGTDAIVGVSIAILIILFLVQRFGTDKVGNSFAPIICLWFALISGIGLYNLFKYNLGVLKAFNPIYIKNYFKRNGKRGWISLGGIVLCITGTEAMFADLGHFNVRAVQISFSAIVFPALVAAYSGQAAYLTKFPTHVHDTFYDSIPDALYWPTFVVANAAAIIASQALITGAFAIISQSQSLSCFPRVKIVHTSAKHEGQVYIPEVNYMLMIACVAVCLGFRTTEKIGHAYGIAVVAVMVITTCLVTLIMLLIWKTSIWWISIFFVVFMGIELTYLSSVFYKFIEGGYLPLAFSLVLMSVMGIWHYVNKQRYMFELKNKVSADFIKDLATKPDINRVPGIGLLFSELVQGIPPIFPHFIEKIPSIHSVLVFVSIKYIPISKISLQERFLFRQVEPRDYRMFRCVVRYGYKDQMEEPNEFEKLLVQHLKDFIRQEQYILDAGTDARANNSNEPLVAPLDLQHLSIFADDEKLNNLHSSAVHVEEALQHTNQLRDSSSTSIKSIRVANSTNSSSRIVPAAVQSVEEEIEFVQKAMERGVVYLLGETEVLAKQKSSFFKKFIVNYAYSFLRKNFRQGDKIMAIPQTRLLRVGMAYEI